MTDPLSFEVLLQWLEETCAAREWCLQLTLAHSRPKPWSAIVTGNFGQRGYLFRAGNTRHEALSALWAQVQRHCREEATRRPA